MTQNEFLHDFVIGMSINAQILALFKTEMNQGIEEAVSFVGRGNAVNGGIRFMIAPATVFN